MFSAALSSGLAGGIGSSVRFSGIFSLSVVCQPARSSSRIACAPVTTVRAISSRCFCIASVSAEGIARAAPVSRAGQTAPNR